MEENAPKNSGGIAGFFEGIGNGIMKIGENPGSIVKFFKKFRKVLLAIPVVILSIWMAIKSGSSLPEYVGIHLLETGEYALTVSRAVAVFGPVAITAFCLLMMFCSRKTFYPWLISLFTLILPLVLILTNSLI